MSLKEYKPGTAFNGVIGRTFDQSEPAWPEPNRARKGSPNVLFIILDDTGFGQLGCYGSPIRTPNLDSLAEGGLRYNSMHTTALCSPTRTCILTGRNHHSNAMACITEGSTGYPGSNGNIPFENGFLSEMLLQHGYNTYAVGKWHLTPADQISAAGPYDRWPLGRGFERFYGFLGGETHQYYPELVYDNHQVEPPKTPEEGYHLTEDLVDKAVSFIADSKQVAPDKPFFMYFCTGAMHAPHHVPKEWADQYKGQFDDGWEAYRERTFAKQKEMGIAPPEAELSRHDPDVPRWGSLSADEHKLYARMMEVFAGFLTHTDFHIGRLLDFLKTIGEFDNTLIMVLSDNGASSEGGPTGSVNENLFFNNVPESLDENLKALDELGGPDHFNHYAWGWTWAGDTPFRRWKRETYRGGISDPFIVHWPAGFQAKGEIRTQYGHAIDMVPTVLEALDLEPPLSIKGVTQSPIEGLSLAHTFDDPQAESKRRTQYFEMMGHRSLYHDGWRAVCPWPGPSFTEAGKFFGEPIYKDTLSDLDANHWELYHIEQDFAENHNVAADNRARLIDMIGTWYVEAGKYNVLPVDGRGTQRFAEERPQLTADRQQYTLYPGTQGVPYNAGPRLLNRSHSITARVEIPAGGAQGVLVSFGGTDGGYSLYVQDGKLHYVQNYVARQYLQVASTVPVPDGSHELRFEFEVTGKPDIAQGKGSPGHGQLYIDGQLVGETDFEVTTPLSLGLTGGITVGADPGAPVAPFYEAPFAFTGTIHSVTFDLSGELIKYDEAEMRRILARQEKICLNKSRAAQPVGCPRSCILCKLAPGETRVKNSQADQTTTAQPRFRPPALFAGLRGVRSADLPAEILAGVTLAALMIPLNIGYAQVAGLPPIVGLYAAILPMLAFAIFSTSRNLVASPDAPIAALIASLLLSMAIPGDPHYIQLALALALLCAVIFAAFWLFRLGFLANFLSRAVLIGFISGLGIEVFTNQLEKILGVTVEAEGFLREVVALIHEIPHASLYSVAIGLGTILIIRLLKRYTPRLPGALIALIVMTALVAVFNLDQQGVSVLGPVPSGLPSLSLPKVSLVEYLRLLPGALAICAVTLAEGLLIARKYAQAYAYKIDPDQEMLAFGTANLATGLSGGLVIGSSASRTAAMDSSGSRSQVPSLVAAVVVALVLLFFADLLALLPNAALGGIVANAVLSLIEVSELRYLYNVRRSEFLIAAVCLASVLVLGSLPAVVIAFLLTTIEVVRRVARPRTAVLTELPGGRGFNASPIAEAAYTFPGLVVYRFGAEIFFANANLFLEQVKDLVENATEPVKWFVLDAEAVIDIDTTGAEALEQVLKYLREHQVTFALARASAPVPELLRRYNLLGEIGENRLYETNRDAVLAYYTESGQPVPVHLAGSKPGGSLDE